MIDNFLVADPPLKQIVARTVEAGFKGNNTIEGGPYSRTADLGRQLLQDGKPGRHLQCAEPDSHRFRLLHQRRRHAAPRRRCRRHLYDRQVGRLRQLFLHPGDFPDACATCLAQQSECELRRCWFGHRMRHAGRQHSRHPQPQIQGRLRLYRSCRNGRWARISSIAPASIISATRLTRSRRSPALPRSICAPPIRLNDHVQVFGLINNALNYRGATYGTLYDTGSTQNQVNGAAARRLRCRPVLLGQPAFDHDRPAPRSLWRRQSDLLSRIPLAPQSPRRTPVSGAAFVCRGPSCLGTGFALKPERRVEGSRCCSRSCMAFWGSSPFCSSPGS